MGMRCQRPPVAEARDLSDAGLHPERRPLTIACACGFSSQETEGHVCFDRCDCVPIIAGGVAAFLVCFAMVSLAALLMSTVFSKVTTTSQFHGYTSCSPTPGYLKGGSFCRVDRKKERAVQDCGDTLVTVPQGMEGRAIFFLSPLARVNLLLRSQTRSRRDTQSNTSCSLLKVPM